MRGDIIAIVGSAQVRISPNTTGFGASLQRALQGTRSIAANAGREAGAAFAGEFQKSFDNSMRGLNAQMGRMAREGAKAYENGFKPEIAKAVEPELAKLSSRMGDAGDKGADSLNKRFASRVDLETPTISSLRTVERAFGDSGDRAGYTFTERFSRVFNSSIGSQARSASTAFTRIYASAAAAGTGITALLGAVSALAGGLFVLGAAAASAAASLVALGGLLGGLIQGAVAVGIAFKGVFSAISAGMKSAASDTGAASAAQVAAARRIADARTRITEVQIRNAQRLADSAARVREAEEKLGAAQRRVLDAQTRLNAARKDAAEELQQLNFSVEDAALAEERAALSLEEAYDSLQKVQDLPIDDRARREAELAFKEAELNYRQAKDRAADLADEQARASETGIEGTKAYVDAQNDLIDAQNDAIDAENDLGKAREEAARTAADAQADLAKAQLDLTRAQEDAARAAATTNSELQKYQKALNELSPSAQAFVGYMVSMKDTFNEFKKAVQEPFFAAFNEPFREMVQTLLPIAQTGLAGTAGVMGQLAAQFAGALTSNATNFAKALEFNNGLLAKFGAETATGNSAIGNMVDVLFRLLEAIKPVTDRFAGWLVTLSESAAFATDSAAEMENLTGFFDRAGDRMAVFGDILGSIFDIIGTLAKAAGPAIDELLRFFQESFAGIATSAKDNIGGLGTYFTNVVENLKPLLELLGQVSLVFLEMGAAPELGQTFEILKGAIEPLRSIALDGASAGPALANLVVTVVKLIAAFAETGALEVFFNTLNSIATVALNFVASDFGQQMIKTVAPALAAFKALSLVFIGVQFAGNLLLGSVLKLIQPLVAVFGFIQQAGSIGMAFRIVLLTIRTAFSALLGPVGIVIAVLALLIPAFIKLYKESASFRNAIDNLVQTVIGLVQTLVAALMPVIQMVIQLFMRLVEALMPVVQMIITTMVPIIMQLVDILITILVPAIKIVAAIFEVVMKVLIATLENVVLPIFTFVFRAIAGVLGFFIAIISDAFKWVRTAWDKWGKPAVDWIVGAWNTFIGFFTGDDGLFATISGAWNSFWNGVRDLWNRYGKPAVSAITGAFDTFRDFFTGEDGLFADIGNAWSSFWGGLWNRAKGPLNTLIGNINKYLIGNLNRITSPFGLTIPDIPKFADGGPVRGPGGPRSDSILARVSNGEYVMNAASVSKFGVGTFDALNRGQFPIGGLRDWAEGKIDGLKGLAGGIADAIKSGPLGAVKFLFDKYAGPLITGLKSSDQFMLQFAGAILGKLETVLDTWAGKKQKDYDEAQASSGTVPPYNGPPGGWTYPLSSRYRGTNWSGHNPPWAVDIASPVGTGVRAASAGLVATLRNLGDRSYGRYIVLSHAGGRSTLYAHLDAFRVKSGDIVKTGQLIGISGNSGGSRGPHLHFELRPGSDTIRGMSALGVRLATGGVVRATPGGVMAMLAEGGRHERVEPLDASGMSNRDRALINNVARAVVERSRGLGTDGLVVKVYIGDQELRGIIRYEVKDNQTGLARDLSVGRRRSF